MSVPGFRAEASLYRSAGCYHVAAGRGAQEPVSDSVVLAYMPGSETMRVCNECLSGCAETLATCSALAMAPLAACVFPPACPGAAATAGALLAACQTNSLVCIGRCNVLRCCPKACSTPNPFDPGAGCCDSSETCVDRYDPNSRQGCCPADQSVCAGKCCAKGESCCGDTCCPPNYYCLDGFCSQYPGKSLWPDDWQPPKRPKDKLYYCRLGYTECGGSCCPPGLECCSIGGGKVACMTNCLH